MRRRCLESNHSYYRNIKICNEWLSDFKNFYRDMGECPEGMTLDRIDSTKGYYKENCRWATHKEQANNRTNNNFIIFDGITKNVTQWAELLKIAPRYLGTFKVRISSHKYTLAQAACTPILKSGTKQQKDGILNIKQVSNVSVKYYIEFDGIKKAAPEWAELLIYPKYHKTFLNRLYKGWDLDIAVALHPSIGKGTNKETAIRQVRGRPKVTPIVFRKV